LCKNEGKRGECFKIVIFSSVLFFSAGAFAEYKINVSSQVLNDKALLKSGTSLVPFDETGTYGNIALIGTNGITEASVTGNSRTRNSSLVPITTLFDGYIDDDIRVNNSAVEAIGRGWFGSIENSINRCFLLDLGHEASISGFRLLNKKENYTDLNVRNIRIESSVDGTPGSFTTVGSFTLTKVGDTGVISITTPFTSRYFIFHVVSSYHSVYFDIGELEIFQTQP
jgi:hypothetical protein